MRTYRLTLAAVIGTLAITASASAHNLSLSPSSGDIKPSFRFLGTPWHPRHKVTVKYFASPTANAPLRSLSLQANGRGKFVLNWSDSLIGITFGLTHRMCFSQLDTRFTSTFRKCALFYVQAPYAQWMSTSGNPGDTFVLYVVGFPPGRTLTVTTTPPPGVSPGGPFTVTTATRGSFVTNVPCASNGPTFGPAYVPRGGAACGFTGGNAGPGLYTSLVRDPISGL